MSKERISNKCNQNKNSKIFGRVFDIKEGTTEDGPGLRTTIFLQGCPLNCVWCHNPEAKGMDGMVLYRQNSCISCGKCRMVCPVGCHEIQPNFHLFYKERCIECGACVQICPTQSLFQNGVEYPVTSIIEILKVGKLFFKGSGGGVTISGGEPLFQPKFTESILYECKKEGIHTCIETSGYTHWNVLSKIFPFVDLFLWDIKETDIKRHEKCTGVGNEEILKNLYNIDKNNANIVLRCPLIPGINDRSEHWKQVGVLATQLHNICWVEILPYHDFAVSKYQGVIGAFASERFTVPNEILIAKCSKILEDMGVKTNSTFYNRHTGKV